MIDVWLFLGTLLGSLGVGYIIVQVDVIIPLLYGKQWKRKDAWWRQLIMILVHVAFIVTFLILADRFMSFVLFKPNLLELIGFSVALILSTYVGVFYATIRLNRARLVVTQIINAMFPSGGTISLGAKEVDAGQKMLLFLDKMGGPYANALFFLANGIDSPFLSWYFLSVFTPFSKLSEKNQQLFVNKWMNDPNITIKSLAHAFKAMGSLGYYTDPRIWKEIGFPGPFVPKYPSTKTHTHEVPHHSHFQGNPSHPVPPRNHLPGQFPEAKIHGIARFQERSRPYNIVSSDISINADVCIIGSGSSGPILARDLARDDRIQKVVLLEKGSYFEGEDFNQRELDMIVNLWKGGGMTFNSDYSIFIGQGEALGGTTVLNHAICIDTPKVVLDEWKAMGVSEEITDYDSFLTVLNEIKNEISVNPVPDDQINKNNQILKDGARVIGLPDSGHGPNPRNSFDCRQCGFTHLGCHYNAKQSTLVNYIPQALDTDKCEIYCDCFAEKILYENGKATGVQGVFMTKSGEVKYNFKINAKIVIVCAGAINSTALLLRSKLPDPKKQLGKGLSIHPSPLVVAEFENEIKPYIGIPMSYYISQYSVLNGISGIGHDDKPIESDLEEDQKGGYMLESVFPNPGQFAAFIPGVGEQHKFLMKRLNHYAAAGILIRDTPKGKININMSGEPIVEYSLDIHDKKNLCNGIRKLSEIFLKKGALRVIVTHRTGTMITKEEFQNDPKIIHQKIKQDDCGEDKMIIGSVHPQGGNRMGNSPENSVVDSFGMYHQINNLYVCDASVFPTATGVNPMLTIMGIAKKTSQHIRNRLDELID